MAERKVDFLLVGGGIAGGNCARWLRRSGADGSIVLVGREPHLPYDRPPLSKGYLRGSEAVEDALMQEAGWYEEQGIEALTKVSAMKLDLAARTVKLSNREEVGFGQLLLATGSNVRRLNVDGDQFDGIHYLRTFANSDAIRDEAAGKRVVLIGGSYIGSRGRGVADRTRQPLHDRDDGAAAAEPHVRRTGGTLVRRSAPDHGIEIHGSDELDHFEGADGRVTKVVTKNGLELDADAVVIGAGVHPDIMLARSAGLELGDSGGIRTDSQLRASAPGVFAAGDVAEYSSVVHDGAQIRVEHWDVAFGHGKTVALNMLGKGIDHDVVPYFFSDLSDWAGIEYVGPAREWDQELVRGSFDDGAFTVFYLQSGRVRGALTVGRSDDLQAARRLIADGTELGDRAHVLGDLSSDLETIS